MESSVVISTMASVPASVEFVLPNSKSVANRVLTLNAANGFASNWEKVGSNAEDSEKLWAAVNETNFTQPIKTGEGGTTLRFLVAYFALHTKQTVVLLPEGAMQKRPVTPLIDALNAAGCCVSLLHIGDEIAYKIEPKKDDFSFQFSVSVEKSSQFLSAIMLAAAGLQKSSTIQLVGHLTSLPYIKLTASIIEMSGCMVNFSEDFITILPQAQHKRVDYAEPDWSAAQYVFELAALTENTEFFIPNLSSNHKQGDVEALEIFVQDFNLAHHYTAKGLTIKNQGKATASFLERDFSNNPDVAQAWICTAFALGIKAKATGLHTLKIKETDRILALQSELEKLGGRLLASDKHLEILEAFGSAMNFKNKTIETFNDHRMAMAFAPLSLKVGALTINDPYVVRKSFPHFWKYLGRLVHLTFS
ncbi:MAG: 3-phosphoshikimate 1-carboxyvinyltransferase [Luteibaculaceae bacterium]